VGVGPIETVGDPFIVARTTTVTADDGVPLVIRPIVGADRDLLVAEFERLSPESRYRRFFNPVNRLSASAVRYLTEIDYEKHFAWVAESTTPEGLRGVGVARYIRTGEGCAEAAITVADDFQGRGIGRLLFDLLVLEALGAGVACFEGEVLAENTAMLGVLEHSGARVSLPSGGICRFSIDLPSSAEHVRQSPAYEMLRRVARADADFDRHPMPAAEVLD
jgi:GNAT superfamily N-acetyltransferase